MAYRLDMLLSSGRRRREIREALSEAAIGLLTLQYSYLPSSDSRIVPLKLRLLSLGRRVASFSAGIVPLITLIGVNHLDFPLPPELYEKLFPIAIGVATATILTTLSRSFPERLSLSRELLSDFNSQDRLPSDNLGTR